MHAKTETNEKRQPNNPGSTEGTQARWRVLSMIEWEHVEANRKCLRRFVHSLVEVPLFVTLRQAASAVRSEVVNHWASGPPWELGRPIADGDHECQLAVRRFTLELHATPTLRSPERQIILTMVVRLWEDHHSGSYSCADWKFEGRGYRLPLQAPQLACINGPDEAVHATGCAHCTTDRVHGERCI